MSGEEFQKISMPGASQILRSKDCEENPSKNRAVDNAYKANYLDVTCDFIINANKLLI